MLCDGVHNKDQTSLHWIKLSSFALISLDYLRLWDFIFKTNAEMRDSQDFHNLIRLLNFIHCGTLSFTKKCIYVRILKTFMLA